MALHKTLLATTMILTTSAYFSQNTLPANGNVGIGTSAPASALEVMGETKLQGRLDVDEVVTMRDTVKIERDLLIEQDIKVKGEGVFTQQLKAKADLKVLGTTKMKGDAFVEGDFKFKSLQDCTAISDRFLMINNNGKATSLDKAGFVSLMYEPKLCPQLAGGNNPAPVWSSVIGINPNPGVLYTGDNCPAQVGIGTNTPLAKLDVRGSTYISGNTSIGISPNNTSRLYVNQQIPSQNALTVDFTSNSNATTGIGINTIIDNSDRIGYNLNNPNFGNVFTVLGDGRTIISSQNQQSVSLTVRDNTTGHDVFRVYGDGTVYATEIFVDLKESFPDYVFKSDYNLLSIEELRTYISVNGHLPNVPSAEEMEESGIPLKKLVLLQMEKIEELTLYILSIEEKLNEINK